MSARISGPIAIALLLTAAPALAQQNDACRNEVERFADAILGTDRQPSARAGGGLDGEDRKKLGGLVEEARAAAGRNDADACLSKLREARAMARESGIGAPTGSAAPSNNTGNNTNRAAGSSSGSAGSPAPSGSVNPATPGSAAPGSGGTGTGAGAGSSTVGGGSVGGSNTSTSSGGQ